jgi:formyltetrahydrofolate deformylase
VTRLTNQPLILTLSCEDKPGIVARVATAIFEHGGNIHEAHQFDDIETGKFFARIVFSLADGGGAEAARAALEPVALRYAMDWVVRPVDQRRKVLLLVSKFDHCLADLLYRQRIGELSADIVGIVSNHPREVFNGLDIGTIPFHYLPITRDTKAQQEAQIKALHAEYTHSQPTHQHMRTRARTHTHTHTHTHRAVDRAHRSKLELEELTLQMQVRGTNNHK